MMRVSVVVPIYNEQENITTLFQEIKNVLKTIPGKSELIFVDDGSRDGSLAKLKQLAASDSDTRVISFRKNFGQTAAITAGFHYARGEVIIPIDGDGQNDPAEIPRFLAKLDQGYDVVSGWRKSRKDKAITRKFPSRLANWLISYFCGLPLHDYGCTMKAYKSDFVKGIHLYGEMHRFIPVYAAWEGAKVTELEVNHRARTAGVSKYGLNRTFKVLLDLLVIRFLEKYFNKPIYLFGGFGIFSLFLSLLSFVVMVWFKLWGDKTFIQTPLPTLVVTFALVGMQSLMTGLLAEMLSRTYFESQSRAPYKIRSLLNLEEKP